jgi:hypothetical protein
MPKREKIVEKGIDDMVGALTDPIIVYEPGWGVPEKLKGEIKLARLAQLIKHEEGVATDVEAMAYLSNASLVAPMRTEWANVYMYLFTRWMGDKTPEDLRKEEITDYETGLLLEFKRWLWRQRVKVRKERRRQKRAAEKAEAAARAPKQLGLPM